MAKRAHGEGSIYQRKDGRWVFAFSLADGRRKYIYCKTKEEAIHEQRRLNVGDELILEMHEYQTLSEFLTIWMKDIICHAVKKSTYIRYCQLIEHHVLPTLGAIPLQNLSPLHLQKLYNQKVKEGYAPQTIKHLHRVLHLALTCALCWDLVKRNVCDLVKTPRVSHYEIQPFTAEQAKQFLETSQGDPFEALYVLALTTGMRQGELLALKWNDIDFDHGSLHVRRSIARVGKNGFVISDPKTARSRRHLLLTELALLSLQRHHHQQVARRQSADIVWQEQGWVFCNTVGRPVEVSNLVRRSFFPLLEKAGLPRIRFHDLRHTAATLLLSMNVHPKIVQEILGHASITTTLDTYSHVLPSLQAEAVEQLNTLFSEEKSTS